MPRGTVESVTGPAAYLRKLARYARVYSPGQLVLFKVSDILSAWFELPAMRRIRALRAFSHAVPPESLTVDGGDYRFRYPINGREVAFRLRARSSDVDVFRQVVVDGEYLDITRMIPPDRRPPRIIDAGANIGLTTLFFKCFHPEAQILALEPEPGNFARLRRCVDENGLVGVTLLNTGLWTRDTHLAPDPGFRDGRAWSFAIKEAPEPGEGTIPVSSLGSLLADAGWSDVDLVKIDIEGAEAGLVRDSAFLKDLQRSAKLVCMEVHEEAVSRSEVQRAFASVGLTSIGSGETLVAWKSPESR